MFQLSPIHMLRLGMWDYDCGIIYRRRDWYSMPRFNKTNQTTGKKRSDQIGVIVGSELKRKLELTYRIYQ